MRVLVCGSNYGLAYITALARDPCRFRLAGILAQGSVRSQQLAAWSGVPLYCSTGELPDNIDLACAAMSSAAAPVVLQLIRRGIHVLCEHPYPASWLKRAMNLAGMQGVKFHVNGHFASLPASQTFIREYQRTARHTPPEFIEVMATERSLYAALDILMVAMGGQQLRADVLSRRRGFVLLEGMLGKVPLRFLVQVSGKQRSGGLVDGSADYLLDIRLTLAFPKGLVTLLSMAGPVVWSSTPANVQNEEPLWTIPWGQGTRTMVDLREQRIQANVEALNAIRQSILGRGAPRVQNPQHILQVSKAWELIGRQL
jgi:yersiniabactin synthetase, thiazolinyl reductase component